MKPTIGAVLGCALLTTGAAQSGEERLSPQLSPVLQDLRPISLPDDVSPPEDVRWQTDETLLFGLRHGGIYSWRLDTRGLEAVATLSGSRYRRAARYGSYSRLGGGSADGLVFAGDLFGVYRQRDGRVSALKENLEIVGDLDYRDGRAVAVGLARQSGPSPGPDHIWEPYIAWLIGLEGRVRGLLPTRDGGVAMDACFPVELSTARFVSDDMILVVPGAERGAFLYATDGVLRETVDTGVFTATRASCGPEQKVLLDREEFRTAWLLRHRVIDEVAANDDGDVFLFIRHMTDSHQTTPPSADKRGTPRVAQRTGAAPAAVGEGAGREPRTVALGPASFPASEWEELWDDATARSGGVIISGERVARLRAAAEARTDASEGSGSSFRTFSAPSVRVCWDIVHARVDDLRTVTTVPCAVASEWADARLRVDLSDDRAVLLIRSATHLASGRRSRAPQVLEARLRAGR